MPDFSPADVERFRKIEGMTLEQQQAIIPKLRETNPAFVDAFKQYRKSQKTITEGEGPASITDETLKRQANGSPRMNILEEQHPAVSGIDRLLLKNLSNSPDASVAYLKKNLPQGFDVQNRDGRVVLKGPGEKDYRVIDPDYGFPGNFVPSAEMAKDLTDVLADIGSGVGTGLATAAGGLVGGLPGGMAGGALAGGGLEAGRQALGHALGIDQGVQWGDVVLGAGLGGVAPAVFGTGVSPAMAREAGLAANSQSGLPMRALRFFQGSLANVPANVVARAAEEYPRLKGMGNADLAEFLQGKSKEAIEAAKKNRQAAGDNLQQVIAGAESPVDLTATEQHFREVLAELERKQAVYPQYGQEIAELQDFLARRFPESHPTAPDFIGPGAPVSREVPAEQAHDLYKILKQAGKLNKDQGAMSRLPSGIHPSDIAAANEAAGATKVLRGDINEATGGAFEEANAAYRKASEAAKRTDEIYGAKNPQAKIAGLSSPTNATKLGQAAKDDLLRNTNTKDLNEFINAWMLLNTKDAGSSLRAVSPGLIRNLAKMPVGWMLKAEDFVTPPLIPSLVGRAAMESALLSLPPDLFKSPEQKRIGQ